MPEDLSAGYTVGKEFFWWAITSCTSSICVLESPVYVGTSGPRTMFSIETQSGKLIKDYSYFANENEILLPPGRYFRVIDKLSPAKDLHIIHLREINPPYLPYPFAPVPPSAPVPSPLKCKTILFLDIYEVVYKKTDKIETIGDNAEVPF